MNGEYAETGLTLTSMNFSITDPLTDPRWEDLVAQHPLASPFHQRGWLKALYRTMDMSFRVDQCSKKENT